MMLSTIMDALRSGVVTKVEARQAILTDPALRQHAIERAAIVRRVAELLYPERRAQRLKDEEDALRTKKLNGEITCAIRPDTSPWAEPPSAEVQRAVFMEITAQQIPVGKEKREGASLMAGADQTRGCAAPLADSGTSES